MRKGHIKRRKCVCCGRQRVREKESRRTTRARAGAEEIGKMKKWKASNRQYFVYFENCVFINACVSLQYILLLNTPTDIYTTAQHIFLYISISLYLCTRRIYHTQCFIFFLLLFLIFAKNENIIIIIRSHKTNKTKIYDFLFICLFWNEKI